MPGRNIHNLDSFSNFLTDRDLKDLRFNLSHLLRVLDDLEIGLYHSRRIHGALERIYKRASLQEKR